MEGPLLVTHWGLSGPAILKLSAFAARSLAASKYQATLRLSWLPSLNQESCFTALQEFRSAASKKSLAHGPFAELSKRLWQQFIVSCSGLDTSALWADISHKALRLLAEKLCAQEFRVSAKGVFKEEFVTAGGVAREEVNFATMESKLVPGLYFTGEVLDIDGITGGFNFQNAWTTGWIAATSLD
jgi:predicted Rossmann fold flavoprotein